jgi:branched-chain amino acid transport system substrate-binding protein
LKGGILKNNLTTDKEDTIMKKGSCVLIFLTAVLCISLTMISPVHAAKTLKIGLVDAYTGPASTYTNDVRDAFQMAVDKINSQGGLLGYQIEVVTRDTKFKVDVGLAAAKELVMRENVDILAGTISSAVTLAVSDLAKREKLPFFVTFAKSSKITGEKGHRYIFQVSENTVMAGKAGAVGLSKKPWMNYWIAGDDYEYGHAIADDVWANLQKLKPGVKLMGQTWWKIGEPDFTPYITAIISAHPDAMILCTGGASNIPFLKAAKATDLAEKVPFYLHTVTELATIRPLGLDAPEGLLGTSNYLFYYPETPENEAFVGEFRKAYNRYPTVGALYGYLASQFIFDGYRKAGKIDKEKLIDAVEGMTVDSPVGKVTMRAYDHQAMLPMFMGTTKKVPQYDFLISVDNITIPAEELMPTIEEVKKARGEE